MRSSIVSALVFALGLFPGASSSKVARDTNHDINSHEQRAACHRDNVLRALQNPDRAIEATFFCQTYINVPTSTGTITYTPILAGLKTVRATQTTVYTNTAVQTNTYTVTVDATRTQTVTQTVTLPRRLGKRTAVPVPDWLTQYPPRRISSACTCLNVPPPSVVVTVTGPPLIYWQTQTIYTTVSKPTTVTVQTSVPTLVTAYNTVTVTLTTTVAA
ncbi:hypothetical protein HJFPF1_04030 [Paramyrothecium foliicola]|nr:hypothetical protein HJFPF1_04030 [Paramyrothecium foliicola]